MSAWVGEKEKGQTDLWTLARIRVRVREWDGGEKENGQGNGRRMYRRIHVEKEDRRNLWPRLGLGSGAGWRREGEWMGEWK